MIHLWKYPTSLPQLSSKASEPREANHLTVQLQLKLMFLFAIFGHSENPTFLAVHIFFLLFWIVSSYMAAVRQLTARLHGCHGSPFWDGKKSVKPGSFWHMLAECKGLRPPGYHSATLEISHNVTQCNTTPFPADVGSITPRRAKDCADAFLVVVAP